MSLARMNNYGAANPHYYQEAAGQICCIVQVGTLLCVLYGVNVCLCVAQPV